MVALFSWRLGLGHKSAGGALGVRAVAQSVTRALLALKRYNAQPDQIDQTILSAINVTLCLASGGDDRVAEGFNADIAMSGRGFRLGH